MTPERLAEVDEWLSLPAGTNDGLGWYLVAELRDEVKQLSVWKGEVEALLPVWEGEIDYQTKERYFGIAEGLRVAFQDLRATMTDDQEIPR